MRAFLLICLIIFVFVVPNVSSTITCSVKTSCSGGEVDLMHMNSTTNSHAELRTQSSYGLMVCCGGTWESLGTSCEEVLLRLAPDAENDTKRK